MSKPQIVVQVDAELLELIEAHGQQIYEESSLRLPRAELVRGLLRRALRAGDLALLGRKL